MLLALLFACVDSEPNWVSEEDLRSAVGRGETASLCAGLRMKEPETREAAAGHLKDYGLSADCICERKTYEDRWDKAILDGYAKGTDAKLTCLGELLDDPAQPERTALVASLAKIPAVRPRLVQAAASDADPAVRVAAMPIFRNTKDTAELGQVTGWLQSDANVSVRAAAAGALFGQTSAADALRAAAKDADPAVRGAAIGSLLSIKPDDFDTVVCAALLEDEASEVRLAALGAMRATRDPEQLACLTARLEKDEPSEDVRAALLRTLSSSADPVASKALCDAIPGWVKRYVKDAPPSEGDDILKAHNNRDFERSYDCAQAALKQSGGYTCHGKAYVAAFFKDVGGRTSVPNCGGGGGSKGASSAGEIVF